MAAGAGTIKLYWYSRARGNFGDDLNPWLWPKLLPGRVDGGGPWLVGIGTLLNHRLPGADELVVVGAGAGLGRLPAMDARWRVFGVRGPLTARALGLRGDQAIGDPAALVADWVAPAAARRGVGFMPHYASLEFWDWRATAGELGLEFVDPEAPVDMTLGQIARLELLVTEAMHGAIVADALRTPWIGVAIDPDFYDWKWRDWGAALGLEPRIHRLPALSAYRSTPRDRLKRALIRTGLGARLTPPPPRCSGKAEIGAAIAGLKRLARAAPQLSTEADHARVLNQLRAAVGRVQAAFPVHSAMSSAEFGV